MAEIKEFIEARQAVTFVDLFAGAGGISEGFMQAYTDEKYYDFLLASDINANYELTHRVRYNHQLGLPTKFICQDIMEDSFLDNLFYHYLKVIKALRPKYFVMENVKGILKYKMKFNCKPI